MKKYNLPVILLNGLILLPHNTIKFEYDEKKQENNVIDMSLLFHDGYILIATKDSKIGVYSKINNKIELPNGNVRIDIEGIKRVQILELIKDSNPLESITQDVVESTEDNELIVKKLYKELKEYIKSVPYISNSVLTNLENITDLSLFIDVVVPNLDSTRNRINEYLNTVDAVKRSEMLLKDIYQEKEMFDLDRNLDFKIKKEMDDTQKEFFLREKIKLIKEELGDGGTKDSEVTLLKDKIDNLDCPGKVKERLMFELKRYESMNPMTPELNVCRDYIDWVLSLPWNIYTNDNEDLNKVRKELDKSHYGLDEVKTRIIEYLAVKKKTNSLRGPIICLVGPPGVGKTSLVYSIASAINRNFVKVSVGGIKDSSEIVGHRRTYVGSNPGRIISSMKKAKSNNPLLLIDEIDKMGRDISDPMSSLLSVLDPEQNKYFSDNYIEEEYDLSNVMFILTANYVEDIPEPLKDRLEIIDLAGYTEFEKLDIAKKHLLPRICKENGLDVELELSDEIILKIIRNYTREAGVRELMRQLSKIVRKIVTQLVVNNIKISKVTVDDKTLERYLGKEIYPFHKNKKNDVGVVNGLAYTIYGGDVLPIEVNYYKGNGNLVLTGSLGEVMKESATIALSYIKSNYEYFNIDYNKLVENDIHIHVPVGAIKKDGPSAGISLTLALISSLTNTQIDSSLALTGEITLRGNILPIGGLKEKSIGALRNGIKKIIIPYENSNDLDLLPKEVKDNIGFVLVKDFKEVMEVVKCK